MARKVNVKGGPSSAKFGKAGGRPEDKLTPIPQEEFEERMKRMRGALIPVEVFMEEHLGGINTKEINIENLIKEGVLRIVVPKEGSDGYVNELECFIALRGFLIQREERLKRERRLEQEAACEHILENDLVEFTVLGASYEVPYTLDGLFQLMVTFSQGLDRTSQSNIELLEQVKKIADAREKLPAIVNERFEKIEVALDAISESAPKVPAPVITPASQEFMIAPGTDVSRRIFRVSDMDPEYYATLPGKTRHLPKSKSRMWDPQMESLCVLLENIYQTELNYVHLGTWMSEHGYSRRHITNARLCFLEAGLEALSYAPLRDYVWDVRPLWDVEERNRWQADLANKAFAYQVVPVTYEATPTLG